MDELNLGLQLAQIPAPIIAAVIAGGVALWVNSRNLRRISANADKAIAAAAASTEKTIAAAAASTNKTIATAEERERRAWIREQTIERAATIIEAADRLDTATSQAAGDLLQYSLEGSGGHVDPHRKLSVTTRGILESFKSAYAEFGRAADLFLFVGEEQPSYAVEMLRSEYLHIEVQVRLLHQFAVKAGGDEDPAKTMRDADLACAAVKTFQEIALGRRELLLHKVRESFGLAPIRLDGYSVSIPATMSAGPVRR